MNAIKKANYIEVTLGSIGKLLMGQSPLGNSYNKDNNGLPLLNGAVDLKKEGIVVRQYTTNPTKIAKRGDLLFCIRATIGNLSEADRDYCIGRGVAALRVKSSVSKKYVWYKLEQLFDEMRRLSQGGVIKGLKKQELEAFKLFLPKEIEVQQRVAQVLSKLDENIAITKDVIKKTKKLRMSLMQELLTRGIGHKEFKKTKLGVIPSEWKIVSFNEIVSIANGQVNPTINPYKSMILVAPNHLESDSGRIIKKETAESQRAISGKYLVRKGDVIYSKIRPYLKKVAVAEEDCLCSADMYPMKGTDELYNFFLFHTLLSVRFTNFVNDISARTGIPKVNREELGFYKFGLPPIPEQIEISNILSKIDEKIKIYERIKSSLEILKKGLMQVLLK